MTQTLGRDATSELRHELRTPVNHILGYAEMLREDTPDTSSDAPVIDGIIATARKVLSSINAALPSTGDATASRVSDLIIELGSPQGDILAATDRLLASKREEQFATDVGRIAQAARRLTAVPVTRPVVILSEARDLLQGEKQIPRFAQDDNGAGKGRILVVDDVEENRAVLERRLRKEGYHTRSVASGEEALHCIRGDEFDLVLLDVLMPGMDGFAVLEKIKSDPATRSIPVIMISALDDLPSVVRCIEHGAEDFLSKPFDPVLLRARIGASLEKKRWHDKEADYLKQVARVIEAASAVEHGIYDV